MTNQLATFNDLVKHALGYNTVFNRLDQVSRSMGTSNFPPYNISVDDKNDPSKYVLELAVAGFSRDDLNVKVREEDGSNYLIIEGDARTKTDDSREYVVKMLASRSFKRVFNLSVDARVEDVELNNGVLRVTVEVVKPQPKETEKIIQIK